jgi:dephospho-CoA kinase
MKKIILIGFAVLAISCGQSTSTQTNTATEQTSGEAQYFGEKITADGAVTMAQLKEQMGSQTELKVKLEAPIEAVCQKKGCWMDVKAEGSESMRVTFKDYAFFVPKDATGKTAVIDGVAKIEETSVADLQEYAKDAGKSKEEIAAITEPTKELVFEADGVIIK